MLIFCEKLYEDINMIITIYDLAAYCYDYMIDFVENQPIFMGDYIWENKQEWDKSNPNLEMLREMQKAIKDIMIDKDNTGIIFEEYIEELREMIASYEIRLVEFGYDENLNHAVIPFFVIKGLELYIKDQKNTIHKRAPLNENYQKNCYVYLNEPCEIISEIVESAKFSNTIKPNEIRNDIDCFIFLQKKDLFNGYIVPNMVTLHKEQNYRKQLLGEHRIKIAVIPFSNAEMTTFPIVQGASFKVDYTEWHKMNARNQALELLDKAIDNDANIIIFPEYVCSSDIQDAISARLKELYNSCSSKLNNLLLVVAGSGWTKDSNNVCKIYSYNGDYLGSQYKYSSYSDCKNEKGNYMMERLANPGKEMTIIKVPGIGNIQIGICRDISEAGFASHLARLFLPAFLLIPAWSPSISIGFRQQLAAIISENHTTSAVLCNCCESFRKFDFFKREIGLLVTPNKAGSVVEGKETYIIRHEKVCSECHSHGCLYMCDVDFSSAENKTGVSIKISEQILC